MGLARLVRTARERHKIKALCTGSVTIVAAFLVNLLHMVLASVLALIGVDYDVGEPCERERPQAIAVTSHERVVEPALWEADAPAPFAPAASQRSAQLNEFKDL